VSLALFIHALSEAFNASASFQPDLSDGFLSANCPVSPDPPLPLTPPSLVETPSCQSKLKCCQLSWPENVLRLSRSVPSRSRSRSKSKSPVKSVRAIVVYLSTVVTPPPKQPSVAGPPKLNEACSLYLQHGLNLNLKSNLSNALASQLQ